MGRKNRDAPDETHETDAAEPPELPTLPALSWIHWLSAHVFCMAGISAEAVGEPLGSPGESEWEAANDFYGSLHQQARHPTALAFSAEQRAWERRFFLALLERERQVDTAPLDLQLLLARAQSETDTFDFNASVDAIRAAVHARPHLGPFRAATWTAIQIGQGISAYAACLFRDEQTVFLDGKPLWTKDGQALQVDAKSFRMIDTFFAVDDRQGYAFVQHAHLPYIEHVVALPEVDASRFTALNRAFASDGSAIYFRSGKRVTRDVAGFELLPDASGSTARSEKAQDRKQTYVGDKTLEGRSWAPPEGTAPCPVHAIQLADHVSLPPAYRLFASIPRDDDGRLPEGAAALLTALREHLGAMFRVGRVMLKAGRYPRVKLTPSHWDKLLASVRGGEPHETFRAEFHDRLDHVGNGGETPSAALVAGISELSLDLALPPEVDWGRVDAVFWPLLETLPIRFAVQGYGIATEQQEWSHREAALQALAVRAQGACGLGLGGEDLRRLIGPTEAQPSDSVSRSGVLPIPDLGFKTLIGPRILRQAERTRLAGIPGVRVANAPNGSTELQIGDRPIWGVRGEEALIAPYVRARSTLARHRVSVADLLGDFASDEVRELAARYIEDWR